MKKMKRLLVLLLAMMMVFSTCVISAYADPATTPEGEITGDEDPNPEEESGGTTTSGTLTVKNSEDDVKYNFYRILDLTGQDTTNPADGEYDAVVYKLNEKWTAFWTTGAGKDYISATKPDEGTYGTINIDGTIKYITITEGNKVEFTNKAMAYAINNNIATDATEDGDSSQNVEVSVSPLGYYLMIPVDMTDEKQNPLTTGSIASLTSTIPDADIYVKATRPSIQKQDNVISADVGQTVTYTVTGKVPNTSGTNTFVYQISDTMSTGLTFNEDVKVEIDGVTDAITSACTIVNADNGFTCTIPVKNYQSYIGKTITLTYTATVNDDAVEVDQAYNTVQLKYGRSSDKLQESTPINEEVYSSKIVIIKYTGDDAETGTKLANAKFALMNSEGKYYKYTAASGETPAAVTWVEVANAPTSGTANVTDAQAQALAEAGDAETITTLTTNANGIAEFKGIKDGTYYLVEFAAPDGYNRLETPQEAIIAGEDADGKDGKIENSADATGLFDKNVHLSASVQNQSGTVLPSTGGMGTTLFYVIGAILVIGAGVILVSKRRMDIQ